MTQIYALQVYETERAFELATRRHLDKDEESKRLALKLKTMEDSAVDSYRIKQEEMITLATTKFCSYARHAFLSKT